MSAPLVEVVPAVVVCVAGTALAGLRWLRVAQREHYLPGACSRFAARWWSVRPGNLALGALAVAAAVLAAWWPIAAVLTGAVVAGGPLGLSLKGRTSPLAWTRRLRVLASVVVAVEVVVLAVGAGLEVVLGTGAALAVAAAVGALGAPLAVDVALAITAPMERRAAEVFVGRAAERLARVDPVVVAITGSYGKTSTKSAIVHLVATTRAVVGSPASYNNRAGLARAVNEHLTEDTEVFVAEMGTYGPGEIAELCRWCPPRISVITAIGPVHLERFGSEDRILEAKSEILDGAETVVLNVDDPRLSALADRLAAGGRVVVRCSAAGGGAGAAGVGAGAAGGGAGVDAGVGAGVDVMVDVGRSDARAPVTLRAFGEIADVPGGLPPGVHPGNLACAVAVAVSLGIPLATLVPAIARLPDVDHRLSTTRSTQGVAILDDTYNSNPAGCRRALAALAALTAPVPSPLGSQGGMTGDPGTGVIGAPAGDRTADPTRDLAGVTGGGRRVVVTPGMVELGPVQRAENEAFGVEAARVATDLVIVGRTNRRALLEGAGRGGVATVVVEHREEAVAWVRSHLGEGDAVLYENDLPDHYP